MKGVAWVSFVGAVVAGAGLAAVAPVFVLVSVALTIVVKALIDVADDRTPNLEATFAALVIPSLLLSLPGRGAATMSGWYRDLWASVSAHLGGWLGLTSMLPLAAATAVVAIVVARQTQPKTGGSGSMRSGGMR